MKGAYYLMKNALKSIGNLTGKYNNKYTLTTLLIIIDIICINVASKIVFYVRFNPEASAIAEPYQLIAENMAYINTVTTIIIFSGFKLYSSLWKYASIKELVYILQACIASTVLTIIMLSLSNQHMFRSYYLIYPTVLFTLTCLNRFSYRIIGNMYRANRHGTHMRRTMIIGGGEACNTVIKELEYSKMLDAKIYCIIDDDKKKHGSYIHGIKVVGGRDKILESSRNYNINEIIISIPSANKSEIAKIIDICKQVPRCHLKVLPGVYQLVNGDVSVSKLRDVEISDLLGRDEIKVVTEKVGRYVSGKVVLVTGGGGSIGSELCRQIAANGVRKLIIFDIYENNAYDIQQELKRSYPYLDLEVLIGSVRNGRKLNAVFAKYQPQIVYHAAAHKHVPLMETSPNEAVKNNVFGTYKVALMADRFSVEKFILISTDKAVNPTNVMGATKRMCEMIIQTYNNHSKTEFAAVRFGNVLGSNGSVIPLFKKQIAEGGPVTVTHPDVIRYFMTIPEAVSLVLQAGANAKGGEIFVLDMGEPVRIVELAENMVKLSGLKVGEDIEIKFTGLRPGEKLYEELLMSEEGLEQTANKQIHIGKPIEFDEKHFLDKLKILYKEVYAETTNTRGIISQIVPTYVYTPNNSKNPNVNKFLNEDYKDESNTLSKNF